MLYCLLLGIALIIIITPCLQTKETFLLPVSNYELPYQPEIWNKKEDNIQKYNNCYSYVSNDLQTNRTKKLHPGENSGNQTSKKDYTCPILEENILTDHPMAYKINYEQPCDKNYYKGFLTVDPKKDFHFYRQDADGYWSHKPGSGKVTNVDASGNYITNPEYADRTYKKYDYKESCMFFCMPRN